MNKKSILTLARRRANKAMFSKDMPMEDRERILAGIRVFEPTGRTLDNGKPVFNAPVSWWQYFKNAAKIKLQPDAKPSRMKEAADRLFN